VTGIQLGEQLSLEGMPSRLLACTPSRLAAFDCPRRYRMTYLDRPAPPRGAPWAHNTLGAVVHLILHRWWSLHRRYRTPEYGVRLVVQAWQQDGFRDAEQSARWRRTVQDWVRNYLATVDPDHESVGVERTVSATTERLAVSGRVDRLDERDGEVVVVDYKTGRRPCTNDDARGSMALALYVLGVHRTLRRPCRRVELHHVPTGIVQSFEHDEESLRRHVTRAEAQGEDIRAATEALTGGASADEAFPPRPSTACSWCDFRSRCPEGQVASRAMDPWAGLAELTDDRPLGLGTEPMSEP
jgi:putative RecB family exonuclease